MLTRFTAQDFKSLVDVSVDLGMVNVFIGANGSGKSNLLEALGILGAAASGRVNDESLKYRGVRPGLPALYKASFRNKTTAQHICFEAESPDASYSVSLLNPIEHPTPNWAYKHEQLASPVTKVGRSPAGKQRLNPYAGLAALEVVNITADDPAALLLELLQNYAIYAPDTPTLRGLEPDPQSREPVGLAGGSLPEGVMALMRRSLSHLLPGPQPTPAPLTERQRSEWSNWLEELLSVVDWLDDLGIGFSHELPISPSVSPQQMGLRFVDRFMNKRRNFLSGYDTSEGVLYLLFYTVLALHPNAPKLFAIDNFDQALNPRTAREFTRLFCQWIIDREDRQALLTTHNPLVLDGLPLRDDRIRLFAVDRGRSGATVVHRVQVTETVLNSAEKGIPLSQQWVMGHFGGVPSGV